LKAGINPMSFSVIVRQGESSFFFSSDFGSIDEVDPWLNSSLSLIEAAHPALEEMALISRKGSRNIFFTHIPQELELEGSWRKELESKFGISALNIVHDGQIFTI
jgi:hypothetical protein